MTRMACLGLFIVSSLVILFAGVFVIGDQRRMFTRTYHLKAEFASVSGLLTGAEVRVGGMRKGTIEDIRLPANPAGKVLVTMSLENPTASLVKGDSVAAIETEGLLGSKFLAISFGSPGASPVRDGDLIASAPPLDMADLLRRTNDIMTATHTAIAGIATLTTKINNGEGTAGAMVNDRSLYNHLTTAATEGQATMHQAKLGAAAFQENMEALKKNVFLRGFFKARGYQDEADLTRWDLETPPKTAPIKTFTFTAGELFGKAGGIELKDPKRLDAAGVWLEQNPFRLVVIRCFSGSLGEQEANLLLTRIQAGKVRAYLAGHFTMDDSKLRTQALGETAREPGLEVTVYP